MAIWAKEIMKLANDFCLNVNKAKEIVTKTDNLVVPIGRKEEEYKYDKAHIEIMRMIMNM